MTKLSLSTFGSDLLLIVDSKWSHMLFLLSNKGAVILTLIVIEKYKMIPQYKPNLPLSFNSPHHLITSNDHMGLRMGDAGSEIPAHARKKSARDQTLDKMMRVENLTTGLFLYSWRSVFHPYI